MEVDPFEARLEFLGLLGKLNASQNSIQKVGNFAMRNKNLYEDLYSCIIEQLEQTPSINARMNIFYVLDSVCHQSQKSGFSGYMELIQKNLPKIIECVAPSGPKGNVNVAGTKKILESWRVKKLFPESAIDKVEKPLSARELGANAPTATDTGLTKDDILRRMDEDRERHKRIREEIWIRPSDEDSAAEFKQNWDEVSDLDDNDYENMETENEHYLPGYPWMLEFDRFLPSPAILKSKAVTEPGVEPSMDSSAFATKRLTSPEGTVSVSSSTAPHPDSTASSHPSYHQMTRENGHSLSRPQTHLQHTPHQQQYHYYDASIPAVPAADAPSARQSVTSPPSTYHSHSRPHYRERTGSNSGGSYGAYANGYGDHS
ncbi:hypothetical protein BGZ99_003488 [Dissophora globulifera]|uniref:CID domain-containing protein n=1 Tax=Dissophora globulifera TaxID=979702 RepID=A0A9P6V040_9FUNG|nr:hypothetical protein BGZ99_003488 [Dissophora globulifera]